MKLTSHKELQKELMCKPSFKKAYDDLGLEFALVDALVCARAKGGVTQAELARKIGTKQSAIARFESGNSNPTLAFVQKLSDALGLELHVSVRQ